MRRAAWVALVALTAMGIAWTMLMLCGARMETGPVAAEILMPGNTVVMGDCDTWRYTGHGMMTLRVNGKTYTVDTWRVALVTRP